MEDSQIVALYWERNENALQATADKYGRYCYTIAHNILLNPEDAEESVNDTYMSAWACIPPHRPGVLSTFLGKITRRISLNRWRERTSQKRGGGEIPLALDELSECIPSHHSTERALEQQELCLAIRCFLDSLPETERDVFVSRYWFLASIGTLGAKFGFSESKVKSMLLRTRKKLREFLTKEGFL